MTKVVVDQQMLTALGGLSGPIEFCDPSGKSLGYFQPASQLQTSKFDLGISEEEIRRREQVRTGRTLDEILADLGRHE